MRVLSEQLSAHSNPKGSNGARTAISTLHEPVRDLFFSEVPDGQPFDAAGLTPSNEWMHGEEKGGRGVTIVLSQGDSSRLLGSLRLERGEDEPHSRRSGVSPGALQKVAFVSDVAWDKAYPEIAPALLYLALRRARIWGRSVIAGYVTDPGAGGAAILGLEPLSTLPSFPPFVPAAQRLEMAAYRAYRAASPELQTFLRRQFVAEAVETLDLWVERFFRSPWFQSIYEGTMTRQQYVYSLSNLHQFVRFTTRHIGRAVAHSHDREIRNHWLKHLSGEVNHEMIIEKDLAALGADVDYVVGPMVPNVQNQQFIMVQESIVAFHQDPVLFMAPPFVAEGFSGRLDQPFIDALERVAKGWGVENPKHVTHFIASHIHYDGGDDGHWEATRATLERYITDETQLQRFLNVVRLCMSAFEKAYTSYAEELAIFGEGPTVQSI